MLSTATFPKSVLSLSVLVNNSNDIAANYNWRLLCTKHNIDKCINQLDSICVQPLLRITQWKANRLVANFLKLMGITDELTLKISQIKDVSASVKKAKILAQVNIELDLLFEMLMKQKTILMKLSKPFNYTSVA